MDEKEVSEMQEEMMTVLVVEPMKAPYVKSIPNELEDLQQAVGGDIEMTYPFEDEVGILLNGNGKFEGICLLNRIRVRRSRDCFLREFSGKSRMGLRTL